MKSSHILTASCIAGGLLGVGLVIYCYAKNEKQVIKQPLKPKTKASTKPKPLNPTRVTGQAKEVVTPPVMETQVAQQAPQVLVVKETTPQVAIAPKEQEKMVVVKDDSFPLSLGSIGPRVERLKVFLMRNYGVFGKIDTYLDDKTAGLMQKHLGFSQLDQKTFEQFKMGHHVTQQKIIR